MIIENKSPPVIEIMKLLRERRFGKLDVLEAKRAGKTVKELRQGRTALQPTGTVMDSINLKARYKFGTPKRVNGANVSSYKRGKEITAIEEKHVTGIKRVINNTKERLSPGSRNKRIELGGYNSVRNAVSEGLEDQNKYYLDKKRQVQLEGSKKKAELDTLKRREAAEARKKEAAAKKAAEQKSKQGSLQAQENLKVDPKHQIQQRLKKTSDWVKKNPGKSAAIGLGSAAIIGGAAYGVKKVIDKRNKKSSEKKD